MWRFLCITLQNTPEFWNLASLWSWDLLPPGRRYVIAIYYFWFSSFFRTSQYAIVLNHHFRLKMLPSSAELACIAVMGRHSSLPYQICWRVEVTPLMFNSSVSLPLVLWIKRKSSFGKPSLCILFFSHLVYKATFCVYSSPIDYLFFSLLFHYTMLHDSLWNTWEGRFESPKITYHN